MATATVAATTHSRFLRGLSAHEITTVLGAATKRLYPRNSVIYNSGAEATHCYFLLSGRARHFLVTPTGTKLILFWLFPGDAFGGVTLREDISKYIVSTEAVSGLSTLVWERRVIRELTSAFPRLMDNAFHLATEYLGWYTASHVALACMNAQERLAQVLLTLADSIGERRSAGVEVRITNEELSNTANLTLFTTSRLMAEWQRSGIITKGHRKVLLHSPLKLSRFVSKIKKV